MDVQELNDLANDIMVSRLTIKSLEAQKAEATKDIDEVIANHKRLKDERQAELLEKMKTSELKSWKTEQANYARATRKSVVFDPILKKQIETRIKGGEEVEGWELKETEYMSIKINK